MSKIYTRKKKPSIITKILTSAFKGIMKVLGIALFVLFIGLVMSILYCHIYKTTQIYYYVYESNFLSGFMISLGLFVGFQITFNFVMAVISNPGDTNDMKHFLRHNDKGEVTRLQVGGEEEEIYSDSDDDGELVISNLPFKGTKCIKCDTFKPLRAHHCSVCGKCVLKMDHHCPWINNCVGHNNQRYFLLMIFWTMIGTLLYTGFAFPCFFNGSFKTYPERRGQLYQTIGILSGTLTIVLIPFNLWNWYLAVSGQTAIEYWMRKSQEDFKKEGQEDPDPRIVDFRSSDTWTNLWVTFGTKNIWKLLFYPNCNPLDLNGVNWVPYINPQAIVKS